MAGEADKSERPSSRDSIVLDRAERIRSGGCPASDLVILDDEFSPSTRQLFEFSIIDRVYGNTLINTTVKHPGRVSHRADRDDASAKPLSSFQEFLGKEDLTILRNFLATGGYEDILPSNDNCVPLIALYRQQNIQLPPGFRSFPLKLETPFPVLYPRHDLRGRNHRALIDCQQTRLVLDAFDHLCQPIEIRGPRWQPGKLVKISQTTITSFLESTKRPTRKRKCSAVDNEDDSNQDQESLPSDGLDTTMETDFVESDEEVNTTESDDDQSEDKEEEFMESQDDESDNEGNESALPFPNLRQSKTSAKHRLPSQLYHVYHLDCHDPNGQCDWSLHGAAFLLAAHPPPDHHRTATTSAISDTGGGERTSPAHADHLTQPPALDLLF
ncbi:hypothetical protein EKO27_g1751 [Xylaria grammica]|uniref:Uncharacterized protein n=1 Tax=Xylaria grammica TaxID=363999 RepID=A0A439DFX0_9PEZI|nr:hypothetical protein EKO27_g1751 [Xylaria grammica]